MARKFGQDFERQAQASDTDSRVGGLDSNNTTNPINGLSDVLVSGLVSATPKGFRFEMFAANSSGPAFVQVWFKFNTLPSAENTIIQLRQGTASTGLIGAQITIDSGGLLRLYQAVTQVGSASSALSTGTIYCLSLQYDGSPVAGSQVVRARINGVEFAGSNTLTLTNATTRALWIGGNLQSEAQTVGSWQYDDVVVDDAAYPSGNFSSGTKIASLRPNAAGDNNAWETQIGGTAGAANNFTRVDETPADGLTSYNGSNTAANIDDYNIDDPPAAVQSDATIPCIYIGTRHAGAGGSLNASFKTRVKASSGGTVFENTNTYTPGSTAFATSLLRSYLIRELDPDGAAWTQPKLLNTQIGLDLTAASTNESRVTAEWLMFEYSNLTAIETPQPITVKQAVNRAAAF